MKLLGFTSVFLLGWASGFSADAQPQQLAGTAWKGMIRAPRPTEVVFQFKADTLVLYNASSKVVLETSRFTQKDGQYTCQKISGNSPCDATTIGRYSYRIDRDVITITPVLDMCMARVKAFLGPLKKISWPAN